jgi:Reverse transcriptase (RNA-dependent DNA polymerase)
MDDIPIKFIRLILPQILSHITHIFNTILTSSCFPATWKISKIFPLAKKSNPSALSDYRPISILPALSKALEVIMKRQITQHIDSCGLLNKFQSGFRKNHSTTTALLKIHNDLSKATDAKLMSFLVLLDFSKAFDSVDHQLLCEKLMLRFGFTSSAISMIKSYLADRVQCVSVDGVVSEVLPVTAGVVQGSILGPLLFSLFIDDICSQIKACQFHMYADDVQVYTNCRSGDIARCINNLNADLNRIHLWSITNGISINTSKSQAMIINKARILQQVIPPIVLGGDTIQIYNKFKNLGVIFNDKLNWNDHVNYIRKNTTFSLRRLWSATNFASIEVRKKLVTSLIVPKLLYCDIIFSRASYGISNDLKQIFNSCARYIFKIHPNDHITEYTHRILGISPDLFFCGRMCVAMKNLIATATPSYLFDELEFGQSRRLHHLRAPAHRTTMRAKTFFVQGVKLWNILPLEIRRENSVGRFRDECRTCLRQFENGGGFVRLPE